MNILVLPDGSAIERSAVKAIIWNKSTNGTYPSKAVIRIYGTRTRDSLFGLGHGGAQGLEQIHFCQMESDDEAENGMRCSGERLDWRSSVRRVGLYLKQEGKQ